MSLPIATIENPDVMGQKYVAVCLVPIYIPQKLSYMPGVKTDMYQITGKGETRQEAIDNLTKSVRELWEKVFQNVEFH